MSESVQEAAFAAAAPIAPPVPSAIVRRADLPVEYVLPTPPVDLAGIDALLLEATRAPAQKGYIARYRLATLGGDYLARLTRDGTDWVFTCPFERYPAPAIAAAIPPAAAIDAITHVSIEYTARAGAGTVHRSQEFQSVSVRADGIVATLRIGAVPDQDEIYNALTSQVANARLTVWREPRIGVPVPQSPPEAAVRAEEIRALAAAPIAVIHAFTSPGNEVSHSEPVLLESMTGAAGFQTGDRVRVRSLDGTQCLIGAAPTWHFAPVVSPPDPTQQMVFTPMVALWAAGPNVGGSPGLPGMGPYFDAIRRAMGAMYSAAALAQNPALANALLMLAHPWVPPPMPTPTSWCTLEILPASHPAQGAKASLVARKKAELEAAQREAATSWFTVRQPSLVLDVDPQPFCIPADMHPNVYAGVKPTGAAAGGLRAVTCGSHVYYQDVQQRQRFYYLPDRFELMPRSDAVWPRVRIRATIDPDTFLVEYVAGPVVDRDRLQGDAAALLDEANRLAASPGPAIEYEPLLGDRVTLALMVPGEGGWHDQPRPGTIIDLYHTFTDVVTVDSAGLRLLYDALFDADGTPFRGTIDVMLGTATAPWAHHQLPFVAHVDGSPEAFWNAAFDPTIAATRQRPIEVIADAALFARTPSVAVAFEHGGVVLLTAASSRGSTNIAQPIGDYVLGVPDAGTYRYQLKGTRDGAAVTSDWRTAEGSTLRLASW